jgi:hypothetical protein
MISPYDLAKKAIYQKIKEKWKELDDITNVKKLVEIYHYQGILLRYKRLFSHKPKLIG